MNRHLRHEKLGQWRRTSQRRERAGCWSLGVVGGPCQKSESPEPAQRRMRRLSRSKQVPGLVGWWVGVAWCRNEQAARMAVVWLMLYGSRVLPSTFASFLISASWLICNVKRAMPCRRALAKEKATKLPREAGEVLVWSDVGERL